MRFAILLQYRQIFRIDLQLLTVRAIGVGKSILARIRRFVSIFGEKVLVVTRLELDCVGARPSENLDILSSNLEVALMVLPHFGDDERFLFQFVWLEH